MGGIAFRAPVLATLFLIVALATLAMPGSSNFVGEFMILLGVFKAKLAIACIAFAGVVGAAVYALRVFIGAMHNRVGPGVDSREIGFRDLAGAGSARRRDPRARVLSAVRAAADRADRQGAARRRARRRSTASAAPMTAARRRPHQGPAHRLARPVADHGARRRRAARPAGRPGRGRGRARARGAAAHAAGARRRRSRWRSRASSTPPRSSPARCGSTTWRLILDLLFCVAAIATVLLSLADAGVALGRRGRIPRPAAVQRDGDGGARLRPEPRHRCSSGSSCCRSRSTCSAPRSSAARARWSPG